MPAEAWEPYRKLYPELFSESRWRLPCACYLIRVQGIMVLVDTAVGPPGLWGWVPEREGRLVPGLAELGVEPSDVDVVFLTHVHIDHIGWNADADGTPMFPNARYLIQPEGLAWLVEVRSCHAGLPDPDGGGQGNPGRLRALPRRLGL